MEDMRIAKEWKAVKAAHWRVELEDQNIRRWNLQLPARGRDVRVEVRFPAEFPHVPPEIRLPPPPPPPHDDHHHHQQHHQQHQQHHQQLLGNPAVYQDGRVCLPLLAAERWSYSVPMCDVLAELLRTLEVPAHGERGGGGDGGGDGYTINY
ncbi:ubiquitin/ISG15-conjugating enzyme E2 L6-like [Petromyzon marinus]|uniref:ubiquitin/ISG15-conjugating enzyme E2 L6-like n=1 Tax=Petromyzon marinus TaxID=7757 RepID=UPI003F72D2E2